MNKKRKIPAIFILMLMLVLGFYQERIKIGINYYLDIGDHIPEFYEASTEERDELFLQNRYAVSYDPYSRSIYLDWLNHFSRSTIENLKWIFTILFTLINLALALAILQLWFQNRKYLKWVILFYGLIFGLAGVVFVSGKLLGMHEYTYLVARKLMGALQSPIPVMVFFPIIYFYDRLKDH